MSSIVANCCTHCLATGSLLRTRLRGKVFIKPLPSNGSIRHNTLYVEGVLLEKVQCIAVINGVLRSYVTVRYTFHKSHPNPCVHTLSIGLNLYHYKQRQILVHRKLSFNLDNTNSYWVQNWSTHFTFTSVGRSEASDTPNKFCPSVWKHETRESFTRRIFITERIARKLHFSF
jgi:hypothetical protein